MTDIGTLVARVLIRVALARLQDRLESETSHAYVPHVPHVPR